MLNNSNKINSYIIKGTVFLFNKVIVLSHIYYSVKCIFWIGYYFFNILSMYLHQIISALYTVVSNLFKDHNNIRLIHKYQTNPTSAYKSFTFYKLITTLNVNLTKSSY